MNFKALNRFFDFSPREFWGAEFLDSSVRIVGIRKSGEGLKLLETFEGSYEDAQTFAAGHFLKFKGIQGAFSHLPVKIKKMEGIVNGEEDEIASEENRLRPAGLLAEDVTSRMIMDNDGYVLVQVRDEILTGFLDNIPEDLNVVRTLTASQLVVHRLCSGGIKHKHFAGIILEDEYTLLILYKNNEIQECVTIPFGLIHLHESRTIYAAELKKVLVYYWQSNLLEKPLEAVYIFQSCLGDVGNGADGELFSNFAEDLDLPFLSPELDPDFQRSSIPDKLSSRFLSAGFSAFLASQEQTGAVTDLEANSIAEQNSSLHDTRSVWLQRAGIVSKAAVVITVFVLITAIGFMAAAGTFRIIHSSQSKGRSEEMSRLSEIKKQKKEIYNKVRVIHGIVKERSRVSPSVALIASALPEKLWLSELELRDSKSGKYVYDISGYAYSESKVSEMLAGLEKQKTFSSVKLVSTELIDGKKIRQLTKLKANEIDLIFFKVSISE